MMSVEYECVRCGAPTIEPIMCIKCLRGERLFAAPTGLGVNRVGTKILGLAWGEQDRPDAALLGSVDEVRAFIVQEWLGDGDSAILEDVMRELAAHDWEESREKTWTFEVGGLSLQDVFDMTPNT